MNRFRKRLLAAVVPLAGSAILSATPWAMPAADASTPPPPPVPAVASVLPSSGPIVGGTQVTIAGTGLGSATAVDFGGNPGSIVSDTATQLVAVTPPGVSTVDVTVTTAGGTSPVSFRDRFGYVALLPTVTSVSPGRGLAAGGTQVVVLGTNLERAIEIFFGNQVGTIVSDTSTRIVATAPAGSGTVDVAVLAPGGITPHVTADHFTYGVASGGGYRVVTAQGAVSTFGGLATYSGPTKPAGTSIAGVARTAGGYWVALSDGQVLTAGAAQTYGAAALPASLGKVVGIVATADGNGYWLATSAGAVLPYGDAVFHGSLQGESLASPIVGIAGDASSGGYLLASAAGNVYNFGTSWYGSPAADHTSVSSPIVGISVNPTTGGYLVASAAGNVYNFGAPWHGSLAANRVPVGSPIVAIAADPATGGYWLASSAGNVYNFSAPWYGSPASQHVSAAGSPTVVAISS